MTHEHDDIVALLAISPDGLSRGDIYNILSLTTSYKTLQRRLASLLAEGKIRKNGEKRNARYYAIGTYKGQEEQKTSSVFTSVGQYRLKFLDTPSYLREKTGYNRKFLDDYVPNQSFYLPHSAQESLLQAGKRFDEQLAVGTYARHICQRLLIDLSYNSSRLEGNTYSLSDTKKLVEDGVSADGKIHEEAVMILNHKEAILFLVENASDITLNSLVVRNLHQLLSQDLLANPASCGNIRSVDVSIGKSSYKPLNNPHLLLELLELILYKAQKIDNPFEQSFFLLTHLSYLQAFEDVNKRAARLSCNIPFIKHNLCPLSFVDVSQDDYTASMLAIYEKNDVTPLVDLFRWAYLRSCEQYEVTKSSLGEIDSYRIQYRSQRKAVMGNIIRRNLHASDALQLIEGYCQEHNIPNIPKFVAMTLADLEDLHVGAIIGLGVTENQFMQWVSSK